MSRTLAAARVATMVEGFDRSPAYRGLAEALRRLIADGRIPLGVRLPSERTLTDALAVSRTTVARAYADLREAGYLASRQGSGSVAALPHEVEQRRHQVLHPGLDDLGEDVIDLTCAATSAVPGTMAAFEAAMQQLPTLLAGPGYTPAGLPDLREAIAQGYRDRGLPTTADQIIVTPGALAAVAVAIRAAARTGDRALLESPTYANVIETTRRAGARIVGVEVSHEGWDVDLVTATVRQVAPRISYTIPDFHNPTAALMPDADREQIAATLTDGRVTAIADESLVDLGLDDEVLGSARPAPFASYHSDTITVGSTSKSIWGGLRIGWLRVPRARFEAALQARLSLDLGAPPLEQLVALHLMRDHERVLAARRDQVRGSRDALLEALAEALPDWRANQPRGGLCTWIDLGEESSTTLSVAAARQGLLLPAGPAFAPEGGMDHFLRIPYTQEPAVLREAVRRLAIARATADDAPLRGQGLGPTLVA